MVYSGMGPDYRVLVDRARKVSHTGYKRIYNEYPPTRILVQDVARVVQEATQSGGVRPYGVSLLIAGWDEGILPEEDEDQSKPAAATDDGETKKPSGKTGGIMKGGPMLYQVDPSGSYFPWKATAIGKSATTAKTFLEKRYTEGLELEDAIHIALLTLKETIEGEMTGDTIEIGKFSLVPTHERVCVLTHLQALLVLRRITSWALKVWRGREARASASSLPRRLRITSQTYELGERGGAFCGRAMPNFVQVEDDRWRARGSELSNHYRTGHLFYLCLSFFARRNELLGPAATETKAVCFSTLTFVQESTASTSRPRPSCPLLLDPITKTSPDVVSATRCASPTAISAISWSSITTGIGSSATSSPARPAAAARPA